MSVPISQFLLKIVCRLTNVVIAFNFTRRKNIILMPNYLCLFSVCEILGSVESDGFNFGSLGLKRHHIEFLINQETSLVSTSSDCGAQRLQLTEAD